MGKSGGVLSCWGLKPALHKSGAAVPACVGVAQEQQSLSCGSVLSWSGFDDSIKACWVIRSANVANVEQAVAKGECVWKWSPVEEIGACLWSESGQVRRQERRTIGIAGVEGEGAVGLHSSACEPLLDQNCNQSVAAEDAADEVRDDDGIGAGIASGRGS